MMYCTKDKELANIKKYIIDVNEFNVLRQDEEKPWGAYYRLSEHSTSKFIRMYFPHNEDFFTQSISLSPKFLVFEPGKRLSLQFHERRSEHWKVLSGTLTARIGEEDKWIKYYPGDRLFFDVQEKHRAGVLEDSEWCVVAEIWQHIDPCNPSDEDDIIRLDDDFNRIS